jgi:hypothetical protein
MSAKFSLSGSLESIHRCFVFTLRDSHDGKAFGAFDFKPPVPLNGLFEFALSCNFLARELALLQISNSGKVVIWYKEAHATNFHPHVGFVLR